MKYSFIYCPHGSDLTQTTNEMNEMNEMKEMNETTSTTNNYWTATAAATTPAVLAVEETKKTHVPGFKLTHEERMNKCDQHKYGICVTCHAGLDDRSDFTHDPRVPDGLALMCNACCDYYTNAGYMSCEFGPFSNAAYK